MLDGRAALRDLRAEHPASMSRGRCCRPPLRPRRARDARRRHAARTGAAHRRAGAVVQGARHEGFEEIVASTSRMATGWTSCGATATSWASMRPMTGALRSRRAAARCGDSPDRPPGGDVRGGRGVRREGCAARLARVKRAGAKPARSVARGAEGPARSSATTAGRLRRATDPCLAPCRPGRVVDQRGARAPETSRSGTPPDRRRRKRSPWFETDLWGPL